jgi:hypothetical protein
MDDDTVRRLHEAGVEISRPPRLRIAGRVLQLYDRPLTRIRWRTQPAYRHVIHALALPVRNRRRATARLLGAVANIDVARFCWYFDYLTQTPHAYRNVMLTDVRDVIILGHPFDFEIGDAVHVFTENDQLTLDQNVNNRGWLLGAYGKEAFERIADRPIICAGVTIGAFAAVVEYLTVMVDHLGRLPRQPRGADQGVHNYVVHNGLVPRARVVANRAGAVLTVGLMAPDQAVSALRERIGEVKVVHQYDRHPEVREILSSVTGRDLRAD